MTIMTYSSHICNVIIMTRDEVSSVGKCSWFSMWFGLSPVIDIVASDDTMVHNVWQTFSWRAIVIVTPVTSDNLLVKLFLLLVPIWKHDETYVV